MPNCCNVVFFFFLLAALIIALEVFFLDLNSFSFWTLFQIFCHYDINPTLQSAKG